MSFIKQIKGTDVNYLDDDLRKVGGGYITNLGKVALTRCPKCHKENYVMNILHGLCAWCGFDANEEGGK